MRITFFLYSILIAFSNFVLKIASYFNPKVHQLLDGRNSSFDVVRASVNQHKNDKIIWFHCASLGEFEQGRPLIEMIRIRYPEYKIYLSFFSPSGYEIRKNYPFADCIFYLPSDTRKNASDLVNLIKPEAFVLTKYDYWWNLLSCLQQHNTPVYLISAVFRPGQYFLHSIFFTFRKILMSFQTIFVQDEPSEKLLVGLGFNNVEVNGDNRIDRVLEIVEHAKVEHEIMNWCKHSKTIVYGSIWESDIFIIEKFIKNHPEFKHIIVPHDISDGNIQKITTKLNCDVSLYSAYKFNQNILVVNRIGLLNQLYKVGNLAYVGGGFGKGIHNTLEPAAYGIPVIFGPNYKKFIEAGQMIEKGIAFSVKDSVGFESRVSLLITDSHALLTIKKESAAFFEHNRGATERAVKKIMDDLHLKHSFVS